MKNEKKKERSEKYRVRFIAELSGEWELLSEFTGSHEPITARHIPCGGLRTAEARRFFTQGCLKCANITAQRTRAKKRAVGYVKKIEHEYNVKAVSEYIGAREPMKWRCNDCGGEIIRNVENILFRGGGYGGGLVCDCHRPQKPNYKPLIRVLKQRIKALKDQEEMEALCRQYTATGYEILSISKDTKTATLKHTNCGHVFHTDVWRMRKGHGCKACSRCGSSYGVQQIEKYLRENEIQYKREVTFRTCKRERMLPFDFAIYDHLGALRYLIEYQGEQHYRARPMFGGEEKLQRIQEADRIKREWCRFNGIRLISIKWNESILGNLAPVLDSLACARV